MLVAVASYREGLGVASVLGKLVDLWGLLVVLLQAQVTRTRALSDLPCVGRIGGSIPKVRSLYRESVLEGYSDGVGLVTR